MKEPYSEDLASHTGPESCGRGREGAPEALTGVHIGQVLSRENGEDRGADGFPFTEGNTFPVANAKTREDLARSKTLCMYGTTLRENREIPWLPTGMEVGRVGKSKDLSR